MTIIGHIGADMDDLDDRVGRLEDTVIRLRDELDAAVRGAVAREQDLCRALDRNQLAIEVLNKVAGEPDFIAKLGPVVGMIAARNSTKEELTESIDAADEVRMLLQALIREARDLIGRPPWWRRLLGRLR